MPTYETLLDLRYLQEHGVRDVYFKFPRGSAVVGAPPVQPQVFVEVAPHQQTQLGLCSEEQQLAVRNVLKKDWVLEEMFIARKYRSLMQYAKSLQEVRLQTTSIRQSNHILFGHTGSEHLLGACQVCLCSDGLEVQLSCRGCHMRVHTHCRKLAQPKGLWSQSTAGDDDDNSFLCEACWWRNQQPMSNDPDAPLIAAKQQCVMCLCEGSLLRLVHYKPGDVREQAQWDDWVHPSCLLGAQTHDFFISSKSGLVFASPVFQQATKAIPYDSINQCCEECTDGGGDKPLLVHAIHVRCAFHADWGEALLTFMLQPQNQPPHVRALREEQYVHRTMTEQAEQAREDQRLAYEAGIQAQALRDEMRLKRQNAKLAAIAAKALVTVAASVATTTTIASTPPGGAPAPNEAITVSVTSDATPMDTSESMTPADNNRKQEQKSIEENAGSENDESSGASSPALPAPPAQAPPVTAISVVPFYARPLSVKVPHFHEYLIKRDGIMSDHILVVRGMRHNFGPDTVQRIISHHASRIGVTIVWMRHAFLPSANSPPIRALLVSTVSAKDAQTLTTMLQQVTSVDAFYWRYSLCDMLDHFSDMATDSNYTQLNPESGRLLLDFGKQQMRQRGMIHMISRLDEMDEATTMRLATELILTLSDAHADHVRSRVYLDVLRAARALHM